MDYYQILGVKKRASNSAIEYAYQQKINDPRLSSEEKQLVIDAYQTLIDPTKRHDYDLINDNMGIREVKVTTNGYQTRVEETFNIPKAKPIKKWKLIMWAIIIVVIALLIAAALIWGFVSFFPILLVVGIIILLVKILTR